MKTRSLIFTLMLLSSCSMLHRRETHVPQPDEIADHPAMLYDGSVPREQMTWRGIKLGDPESAIIDSRINHRGKGDWIVCRDGARYRLEKGVVAALGVWDAATIDQLDIHSPADIETRFGKPQSKDESYPLVVYRYADGHVAVLWNTFEQQLNAVNVSK